MILLFSSKSLKLQNQISQLLKIIGQKKKLEVLLGTIDGISVQISKTLRVGKLSKIEEKSLQSARVLIGLFYAGPNLITPTLFTMTGLIPLQPNFWLTPIRAVNNAKTCKSRYSHFKKQKILTKIHLPN